MILNKTDAGLGLNLWHKQAAADRGGWEDGLSQRLSQHGFDRVVSPYLYKRALQAKFEHWAGALKDHPFTICMYRDANDGRDDAIVDEKNKYDECREYVYLGHKGLNHIVIMQEGQCSYIDLPKRYYEFAEIYSDKGGVVNEAGVYMTVMCEPEKIDDEAARLYAFIMLHLGNERMKLHKHGIKTGVAPLRTLQFVTASNTKKDAGLILARAMMRYSPVH